MSANASAVLTSEQARLSNLLHETWVHAGGAGIENHGVAPIPVKQLIDQIVAEHWGDEAKLRHSVDRLTGILNAFFQRVTGPGMVYQRNLPIPLTPDPGDLPILTYARQQWIVPRENVRIVATF